MSGQVKISVIIPGRYREYGDLCRRLEHIVSETAAGLEIIYSPDTSGGGLLQIQYHNAFGCHSEEEIITRKRFECYCRQADAVSILRELCGAQNTLAENEGALSVLTAWLAEECVRLWHSNILPEDREEANACLRQYFDDKLLLAAMAKQYWDTPEEIARSFGRIKSTELKEKKVRTIGIFNYQMWNGGTDRVISILAPMYQDMGYQVVVITAEGPTEKDFPLSPDIPHLQITGTWETFRDNLGTRLDQWDALIKEYSIDLIIYHPWTLHLLVWDTLFLKLRGVAVVFQTHSVFSFLLAEGKSEFSLLTDRLSLGDGIAVTCKADKTFWNCFHENVHHIPNPVSPALTRVKRSAGGQNKIIWIGRFASEKRPMDAIRIMEYVVRQCPDAMLYMVGGGNWDIHEQCRQAVAEKGLGHHVVFTGFQKDVYQYLESASVHVVTSVYEGYSMVLLEAMAHGVPTVMYGMPYLDLCRTDYGVLSVEESNYKQAAAEICRLLKNPSVWRQESQAAVEGFAKTAGYDCRRAWERLISGEISPSAATKEEKVMMRAVVDHYLIGWRQAHAVPPAQAGPEPLPELPAVPEKETAFARMKRKFRGGVFCLREHGVRYTARRIMEKVLIKFSKRQNEVM